MHHESIGKTNKLLSQKLTGHTLSLETTLQYSRWCYACE